MSTILFRKKGAIAGLVVFAILLTPTKSTQAASILAGGYDLIQTLPGGAQFDFSVAPSPLDNLGLVSFGGLPTGPGGTDTIIRRNSGLLSGATGPISAEIISLSLVSPTITNPLAFGNSDPYEVFIGLTPGMLSPGTVTVTSHDDMASPPGGTFDSSFTVRSTATFRNLVDPTKTFVVPLPDDTLASTGANWQHIPPPDYPETPSLPAGQFYIGPIVHMGPHPVTFPAVNEGLPGGSHLPPLCDPGEFQEGYHIHEEKHAQWIIDPDSMVIDLTPPSRHCPIQLDFELFDGLDTIEFAQTQLFGNVQINGGDLVPVSLTGPMQTRVAGRVDQRAEGGVHRTGSWQTEMLSMDLSGSVAGLNVQIRQDPNRPSVGRTVISENPPGPVVTDNPNLPLREIPFCAPEPIVLEDGTIVNRLCHWILDPPISIIDEDGNLNQTLNTRLSADLRPPNGQTSHVDLVGPTQVQLRDFDPTATGNRTFETEILSMDLSGFHQLPGGEKQEASLRLQRDAPKKSKGETSLTKIGGGQFIVDSFFDVFTEISIGGGPFQPLGDVHVNQKNDPTRVNIPEASIPVLEIPYCSDDPIPVPGGQLDDHCHEVLAVISEDFDPALGGVVEVLDTKMTGFFNDGVRRRPVELSGPTTILIPGVQNPPKEPGSFDTEILSMDLSDREGTMRITESEEHPSTGKTKITDLGNGTFNVDSFFDVFFDVELSDPPPKGAANAGEVASVGPVRVKQSKVDQKFNIDSFFDIFTEISVDGGQKWIPQTDSSEMRWGPKPRAGDLNGDNHTTVGELIDSFANFTGPVNSDPKQATIVDKRHSDGDNDGSRDITVGDLLMSFADFTGPPALLGAQAAMGFGGAEALSVADLVYNRRTGNVRLELIEDGILGFELKNSSNGEGFLMEALLPEDGVSTETTEEISWANLDGIEGIQDLGDIFPTGLSLEDLDTFLTSANYSPGLSMAVTRFNLTVVPEPRSLVLLGIGFLGIARLRRKHRN